MKFNRLFFVFGLVLTLSFAGAVVPFGAQTTFVNSTRAPADVAGNLSALAGNVTEMTIYGYTVTQAWQGYFGNVSGTIQLTDANDNVMYNWSLADPEGEVYASESNAVNWANIACFDWATNGAALEATYNIASDDVDGIDETFGVYNHPLFYTNNIQIDADSCMSANIYDDGGVSDTNNFDEVILTDGSNIVFTSLLEEASVLGFDGRDHDFEMLVLEDGHGTDTASRIYYFYVELE